MKVMNHLEIKSIILYPHFSDQCVPRPQWHGQRHVGQVAGYPKLVKVIKIEKVSLLLAHAHGVSDIVLWIGCSYKQDEAGRSCNIVLSIFDGKFLLNL